MKIDCKTLIRSKLNFLEERGFQFREFQRMNFVDKTKRQTTLVYENGQIIIEVEFFNTKQCFSFIIFISKASENKGFSYNDYLKLFNREANLLNFKSETESEYINRVLDEFKIEAQTNLSKVLSGQEWIHVPSDYGR